EPVADKVRGGSMKCSRCQKDYIAQAKFCPHCGVPVDSPAAGGASYADLQAEIERRIEQQTATAQILRGISSSLGDLQPVLEVLAESAARICGATDAIIQRVVGQTIQRVAHHGPMPLLPSPVRPLTRGNIPGRAALDCRAVHVHDLGAPDATREYPDS